MRWGKQVWREDRKEENCLTVGKSGLEEVGKERRSESQDQAEVLVSTGFNMASFILKYKESMVTFVIYSQIVLAITCNGPFNVHPHTALSLESLSGVLREFFSIAEHDACTLGWAVNLMQVCILFLSQSQHPAWLYLWKVAFCIWQFSSPSLFLQQVLIQSTHRST